MIIKRVLVALIAAIAINLSADAATNSYVSNDTKNENCPYYKFICPFTHNNISNF